ncbi:MAG TPA: urea ABC transporter permease subunit UrtB [Gemmataceae bacterium]|nr:urea ABC transporter permease subunit UrtB [Gemmataceae bacterium]
MIGTNLAETLFNSLSFSSILILTALGLAITFGVMRVINMAHGEMLMLGAYTAYVIEDRHALPTLVRSLGQLFGQDWQTSFGLELNLFVAIPAAFLFVSAVGYLLEVSLIRHLYGRPLDTLLATWGVSLILQQVVKLLFGADLKAMHIPEVLDNAIPLGGFSIPLYRVFIVGVTALCLLAVYLWFYKTSFGLQIRAVTQNRQMAAALGISTRRVDALTFAFASGLAGVAGCIFAHLYTAKYNMGPDYVVEAFMTVITGGMGALFGSVAGGLVIGTGEGIVEKILVNATMAKVVVLLLVIVFILFRPAGIFAPKERAYD